MKIKLLIVDDNDFFRNGLAFVLSRLSYIKEVHEASNGIDFHNKLKALRPDIVFMDIKMPEMNGIEATKLAIELNKDIKIIALSMFDTSSYIQRMIGAGAKGYILKDSGIDEIENAIQSVMNNKYYYSEKIIDKLTNIEP